MGKWNTIVKAYPYSNNHSISSLLSAYITAKSVIIVLFIVSACPTPPQCCFITEEKSFLTLSGGHIKLNIVITTNAGSLAR